MDTTSTIFPPEAVCEIFYGNEWHEIKAGTFQEFVTGTDHYSVRYTRYTDPDGSFVFVLDRIISGWRIDSNLVVLTEENTEPQKELS